MSQQARELMYRMFPRSPRPFENIGGRCVGRPASTVRCRSGFTLLEVVFAVMLSVLLMAALVAAIEMYSRVSWAGREDVARSQLARAILRQMEIDLHSCRLTESSGDTASSTASDDTEADAAEATDAETTVTSVDAAEAYAGESIGVVGDASTLVIHLSRPPRVIDTYRGTTGAAAILNSSDLRSVAYFLASPGVDGLRGAAANALANQTGREDWGVAGLARLEGDPLVLAYADEDTDLQTLTANTRLLASEVSVLGFRYFDGSQWYDAWDSVANERLPRAVEITLGIGAPQTAADSSTASTGTPSSRPSPVSTNVYRHVVALPAAEPVDATSQTSTF